MDGPTLLISISKKIHRHRNDTLLNHLKTIFEADQTSFNGMCFENSFTIWKYSRASRVFYSVIDGILISENSETKINLSARPSKLAIVITIIIFLCAFYGFNPKSNISELTIGQFLIGVLFALLFVLGIGLGYLYQEKKSLVEIQNLINNIHKQ